MKKEYSFPQITELGDFRFDSLCETSSSTVGLEDMPETVGDITF